MANLADKYSKKGFSYFAAISSFAILFYAYLYLIGYFYLFSYFKVWGLNTIEIGFSIVDYATFAIYPFLVISVYSIIGIFGGIFLGQFYAQKIPLKKAALMLKIALVLPLMPLIGIIIYEIIKSTKSKYFEMYLLFSYIVFLYFYYILFIFKISNKLKKYVYKKIVFYAVGLFLIGMIAVSSISGTEIAKHGLKYAFKFLTIADKLPKVTIYSTSPINGFDLFETDTNRYEYLNLLVAKDDYYYLVADIAESESIFLKIWKNAVEAVKLWIQLEESLNVQGLDYRRTKFDEIKESLDEAEKAIEKIQSGRLMSITEREGKIHQIRSFINMASKALFIDQFDLLAIGKKATVDKAKIDVYQTKVLEFNKLSKIINSLFKTTYAIKKDQIAYISYSNSFIEE